MATTHYTGGTHDALIRGGLQHDYIVVNGTTVPLTVTPCNDNGVECIEIVIDCGSDYATIVYSIDGASTATLTIRHANADTAGMRALAHALLLAAEDMEHAPR